MFLLFDFVFVFCCFFFCFHYFFLYFFFFISFPYLFSIFLLSFFLYFGFGKIVSRGEYIFLPDSIIFIKINLCKFCSVVQFFYHSMHWFKPILIVCNNFIICHPKCLIDNPCFTGWHHFVITLVSGQIIVSLLDIVSTNVKY